MTTLYSGRWVLPISSPAIEDGAVAVDGSYIVGVGARAALIERFPAARLVEFGTAAILPGFVNAHSHLELTVMRGFLEREEHDFLAWLKKLTLARLAMTADELYASAAGGAVEAARAGVTCLGDASDSADESMRALREVGLRGIVYKESFGPVPSLATENVARLRRRIAELRQSETELVRVGVSPHSPYTVSAPQLELIARFAIDEKVPLMMHAAESRSESLLLREGRGPFAEFLTERGIRWRPPGISTIQYLDRHGVLAAKPLLAHCATVDDADIEAIKAAGAGVAHCPISNAKLGHPCAPFAKFVRRGLKVGLGSDSVASNNTCDLLQEARFALLLSRTMDGAGELKSEERAEGRHAGALNAEELLFAATLGGARALGLDHRVGALVEGLQADLAIVSVNGAHQQPIRNPVDALVFSSSGRDVLLTVVAGREVYGSGRVKTVDEAGLRAELELVATRMGNK